MWIYVLVVHASLESVRIIHIIHASRTRQTPNHTARSLHSMHATHQARYGLLNSLKKESVHSQFMVYPVDADNKCLSGRVVGFEAVVSLVQATYAHHNKPLRESGVFFSRIVTGGSDDEQFELKVAFDSMHKKRNKAVQKDLFQRLLMCDEIHSQYQVTGTAIVWIARNPDFVVPRGSSHDTNQPPAQRMPLEELIRFVIDKHNAVKSEVLQKIMGKKPLLVAMLVI
jgi:hypothetical protein